MWHGTGWKWERGWVRAIAETVKFAWKVAGEKWCMAYSSKALQENTLGPRDL